MSASSTTSLGNSSANADRVLPKASRRESLFATKAGLDIQQTLYFWPVRAQRDQSFSGLRFRQLHAAMPGRDVFHGGHTLALDGVSDDQRGPFGCGAGLAQRTQNLGNVVTVDFGHLPAKGAPFVGQRLQPHDRGIGVVALQLVVVDQGAEIVELV